MPIVTDHSGQGIAATVAPAAFAPSFVLSQAAVPVGVSALVIPTPFTQSFAKPQVTHPGSSSGSTKMFEFGWELASHPYFDNPGTSAHLWAQSPCYNVQVGCVAALARNGLTVGDLEVLTGNQTVSTAGTTLYRKLVNGRVLVTANNVTLRECRIVTSGSDPVSLTSQPGGSVANRISGLQIIECDLWGNTSSPPGQAVSPYTLAGTRALYERCHVKWCIDGMKLQVGEDMVNCLLELHGLAPSGTGHEDAIQMVTGRDGPVVDACMILGTAAVKYAFGDRADGNIFWGAGSGPIVDAHVKNSLIGYSRDTICHIAGGSFGGSSSVHFSNNRWMGATTLNGPDPSGVITGSGHLRNTWEAGFFAGLGSAVVTWSEQRYTETGGLIPSPS